MGDGSRRIAFFPTPDSRLPTPDSHMITVQNASKLYRIYDKPSGRLKEILLRGRRKYHRDFWALEDVSLEVETGEAVGVIGRNGAGKTTLLQIIAGVLQPTRGQARVEGRV